MGNSQYEEAIADQHCPAPKITHVKRPSEELRSAKASCYKTEDASEDIPKVAESHQGPMDKIPYLP